MAFDHDRGGDGALVARLRSGCDVGDAVEVPGSDARANRFQSPERTAADVTWYEVFPGGCVVVRLESDTETQASSATWRMRRRRSSASPPGRVSRRHWRTGLTAGSPSTQSTDARTCRVQVEEYSDGKL